MVISLLKTNTSCPCAPAAAGPHGLVLGPEGQHIYMVADNAPLPQDKFAHSLAPAIGARIIYSNACPMPYARSIRAPGGWIARFDKNGKLETVAMGSIIPTISPLTSTANCSPTIGYGMGRRHAVVSARPFYHVTSGADFGWRTGTGKWPQWYLDCLPAPTASAAARGRGLRSRRGFPRNAKRHLLPGLDLRHDVRHAPTAERLVHRPREVSPAPSCA